MRCATFVSLLVVAGTTAASDWEVDAEVELSARYFLQETDDPRQDQFAADLYGQVDAFRDWDEGRQRFAVSVNARGDTDDGERSRFDVQEFYWRYRWPRAEVAVGIDRVFWGVTEALHLVDIVNQTDLAASPDTEDKLGQPMLRLTLRPRWGTIDAYVLPRFRERRLPGTAGRLRGPVEIVADTAQFESSDGRNHVDYALRYSHYIGPVEFAVSQFTGTARTPAFELIGIAPVPQIAPVYFQTDQTGLELTYVHGNWLWKLEAISARDPVQRYRAATGGFEYTWSSVFGNADLGLIAEYQYDSRNPGEVLAFDNAGLFNDDLVVGTRLGLNDFAGSELLLLATRDRDNGGRVVTVEASRRLGSQWRLALEGQHFSAGDEADLLAILAREDYWRLSLTRYF